MTSRSEKDKEQWIAETQMFQRIAKVPESSREELALEWESFNGPRRERALKSIKTHRAIQDVARGKYDDK